MSLLTLAIFCAAFCSVPLGKAFISWIKDAPWGERYILQPPKTMHAITEANLEKNRESDLKKWHLGFRSDLSYTCSNRYRPFCLYDEPRPLHEPGKLVNHPDPSKRARP